MITIVGTGHVFDLRTEIERIISETKPDVICVELDEERYKGLMLKKEGTKIKRSGSFLYNLLARFQERAAKIYNVNAGDEMLFALKTAQERGISIALIDMNAQMVFREMFKIMPFKEKIRLLLSSITSLFVTRESIEKEINKLQNDYRRFMEEIDKRFPTVKKILIDRRDSFMVTKLERLNQDHNSILAFVGDGHVPGIEKRLRLRNIEVRVIRLGEIIKDEANTARFSVVYDTNDGPVA